MTEKGSALEAVAALFADGYEAVTQRPVEVKSGSVEDMAAGDIYLGYADAAAGLGEEGYFDASSTLLTRNPTVTSFS